MANDRIRSIDFLPEIFRTETNQRFLASTLDQLVQEPKLKATQGYIGRNIGIGVNSDDVYIPESTATRSNYQLEPSVVYLDNNTNTVNDAVTFPGIIDSLAYQGANTTRYDRLFNAEFYSWDPFIDLDKMVNFGQYFWIPEGPDDVVVSASDIPLTNDFTVTRSSSGYTISGETGNLPTLNLVRGGNYTFDVNQTGISFWIQAATGTTGTMPFSNQSSRDIFGVTNNGEDLGTITFNVPAKTAQDFYYNLSSAGDVDFVTDLKFDQIHNQPYNDFISERGGIDGISDIDGRTVVFTTQISGEDGGWVFSNLGDSTETILTVDSQKYGLWRVRLTEYAGTTYITLESDATVANLSRLQVLYGNFYGGTDVYKDAEGYYQQVPLLTADRDVLYYQDANNANFFGVINILDQDSTDILDVNEILGSIEYTSPNGVVFTNGLKVRFEGETAPASYSGNNYFVEGVGTSIQLLPVAEFVTPESYTRSATTPFDSTAFDVGGFDDTLNAPLDLDYFTINRASPDRNPWSRSNRWVHKDVISATAEYNNTTAVFDNDNRAKRPILEYHAGLKLFNFGTSAIDPINIIDFRETDAFSNINGTIGYSVDGYEFVNGTRVVFAADVDPEVVNKVYVVNFVQFDDSSESVIDLQPADLRSPDNLVDQTLVCLSGVTTQGKSFYFTGTTWIEAQQKISVNQSPLFDVYDSNGYSYGNETIYPSTDFVGSKLFGYAIGSGTEDSELDLALQYLNINNVGDIVFENYLYTDTFNYVSGTVAAAINVQNGTPRIYSDRTSFTNQLGWQTAFSTTTSRQTLSFVYAGNPLVLDVLANQSNGDIPIKVFVDGLFVLPSTYTTATTVNNVTSVTFNQDDAPAVGSVIEVSVISDTASVNGYYDIPSNLENNPLNTDSNTLTLGTVRNHYNSICQNLQDFSGSINGANNIRDLGNIIPYGDRIVQQSAPLPLASTFLYDQNYDYLNAIEFNSNEYEKFKAQISDTAIKNEWGNKTTSEILDEVIALINTGKNELSPFYWTDTIPCGSTYEETVYTVTPITTNVFDTLYSYDFLNANYRAVLVYLNDEILVGDEHEYTVATDGPRITIDSTITLNVGDVVKIREYTSTVGSFVPSTPTKLGMAPAWEPEIFTDNTYRTPTQVIRGHDGSLTVAYGDFRDDLLLEFEKRIYNNIKVNSRYSPPIQLQDVVPGQFRTTDYTLAEINNILSVSFLTWAGANKLQYREQNYVASDEFTWNYTSSQDKLNGQLLLGNWRAIYQNLYDTDSPHVRPWEMLGLTEEPDWWSDEYGSAPYTSGNLVLWEDLRDGKIADPANTRIVSEFARPQLLDIVPVDSEGNLRSPFEVIVGNYDQNSFRKSWTFGDQGPTETAWRRSSSYVFALQRLFALTQPAKYFALNADRDLYRLNTTYNQYLLNNRFRIDPKDIQIYGDNVPKHSYINWIVDYNRILGLDSTVLLATKLENVDVRLAYRLGAFSDKSYLKLFTEKSSPNSLNSSLLLPDESYQLLLYKNPVFDEVVYSSVIVQTTATGYAVFGYDTIRPYFEIKRSLTNGNFRTVTVGSTQVRVARDFSNTIVQVPYGYEFNSLSTLSDFLISYGQHLTDQGMTFDNTENNKILSWDQMVVELLTWADQGWVTGSIINLNPSADLLTIDRDNAVVDGLGQNGSLDVLLNQNKSPIPGKDYVVERFENRFRLRNLSNNTFSFLRAKLTSYEHIIIVDNTSIFNDLIYSPSTGLRQNRILLNGYTTYDWNGTLDAQGFILNQDNIKEWQSNQSYSKGEIVLYKNSYWSAVELLPPKESFDFNDWIKSDYSKITKGLLPNLATKADLIRNYYDSNTANLERDADLLGLGITGFRPRQYMQNLNLDDISQVNLYKQFLKTKGTTQATDIFKQANLGKEVAEYDIFENWAIKRATYGANANRSYFEVRTNESLLTSNPSSIQIIEPDEASQANQTVTLSELYRQSYKLPSTDILPTTDSTPPDVALPTAGYVNLEDADVTVFDFDELSETIGDVTDLRIGSTIWVAKSNSYDWNIYRTNLVLVGVSQVKDNLNGRCTVTFTGNHGLTIGNRIIIKVFNSAVDGTYEVLSVPSLKTVTIALSLPENTTTLTGSGVCFVLESVRVNQASDIADLSFANNLLPTNRVWVDDDGTDHWAVYEKQDPFTAAGDLDPITSVLDNRFGSSVAQGFSNQGALVGATGFNSASGGIYTFNKSDSFNYVEVGILDPTATNLSELGNSLAAGADSWGVAGAYKSQANNGYCYLINRDATALTYRNAQMLSPLPGSLFTDTSDFSTTVFDYSGSFSENNPEKLGVLVDEVVQVYQTDWEFYTGLDTINFFDAPAIGQEIKIFIAEEFGYDVAISDDERWMYIGAPGADKVYTYNKVDVQTQTIEFTGNGFTQNFDTSSVIVVDDDSADGGIGSQQIGVLINNIPQVFDVDWEFNDGIVVFTTAPNEGDLVRITRKQSKTFFPDTATTGFVVEDIYTIDSIYSFSVYVNDELKRPFWDYTYDNNTKTITFTSGVTGTVLVNSTSYWKLVDTITGTTDTRFGNSVSTTTDGRQVIIGAPNSTAETKTEAGNVQVYDRSVERFQVTDSTQDEYTTLRTPTGPVTVTLNGTFLTPNTYNNNGQFSVSGNVITILVTLSVGDLIEIETNTFRVLQSINSNATRASSHFGKEVEQCNTNCSVYIGAPDDGAQVPEGGLVERYTNASRLYGTLTSAVPTSAGSFEIGKTYTIVSIGTTNFKLIGASDNVVGLSFTASGVGEGTGTANESLTASDTIRINNYDVAVTSITAWSNAIAWASGVFVTTGGIIYKSLQAVPISTAISDTDYWAVSNQNEAFVADINTADLPNILATYNSNTTITISLVDVDAADNFIKLQLYPGTGQAFYALGFEPYAYAQTLTPPLPVAFGHFGEVVNISSTNVNLVVGAPDSTASVATTFDTDTTSFDSGSTLVFDPLVASGVVYTFDLLASANASATNPDKFVFGQQIYDTNLNELDKFGSSISYVDGVLLIGSPRDDQGDSSGDFGRIAQFNNVNKVAAWTQAYTEQPIVNVYRLNSIFLYDRNENKVTQYLDYIDPLQGKILGSARANIDYLGGVDPAQYNTGSNVNGMSWNDSYVGQMWWDISTVRFIDYRQDDVEYKSRRWGQTFPGSSIDIYQWIESDVPPSSYTGQGTVYSTSNYVIGSELNPDGVFQSKYYFWVKGLVSVASQSNKTLSSSAISQYIDNPKSSGIPYLAAVAPDTVTLYNCNSYFSATDTILHVEFDRVANDVTVHNEFDLIAEQNPDSFLGDGLYRKMLDSYTGADTLGNNVPDPTLSIADRYGPEFRPRQSFFVDRFAALENYITRANAILARFTISENRVFDLLNSEEAEPTSASGEWNLKLNTYAELTYQDLRLVADGYKYLISSDETNNGLWTIYTKQSDNTVLLTRVQNYDTKLYWSYIDWVLAGYDSDTKPVAEVTTYSELLRLSTVNQGESVKVTSNSAGLYEIYQLVDGEWIRVVLENGTIAISDLVYDYASGRFGFDIEVFDSQRWDQNPITETRQILKAINQELLIDDLAIYKNELLILTFEYILTEQTAPEWLFKTSLIDVEHKIRDLLPYQIYRQDNQDFVQDYLEEVKPYHVKIKEFNLRYDGIDQFLGTLSDFDVPAYYNSTLEKFISPQLNGPEFLNDGTINDSRALSNAAIWQTWPYSSWYSNYTLSLDSITVVEGGSGYTVAPLITVVGDATTTATAVAKINSAGEIVSVEVTNAGAGYTTTPTLTITGGNGTGATLAPVMSNDTIREFDITVKFDRYDYSSTVVDWQVNTKYTEGSLVRYNNKVYSVNQVADSTELDSGAEFDPDFYTVVDESTLSGADRVIGLYTPDAEDPGRELAQVMAGIDYPGVQVQGPNFNQNSGFDVGGYDINVFDNLEFGPEGAPTYSESILDVSYSSAFSDSYLGRSSTDINIEGGEFIDTYSSHAPEELVPGSNFDTLDMRVYTRPGASPVEGGIWSFKIQSASATFESNPGAEISFANLVPYPSYIKVFNENVKRALTLDVDYTIDWVNKVVDVTGGSNVGDTITIYTFGVGGGNQLLKAIYNGAAVGNTVNIPVSVTEINDILIIVNGVPTTAFSYVSEDSTEENNPLTTITFDNTYTETDSISVFVFGDTTPQRSYSYPIVESFIYDGSSDFSLSNSLQGTNPINLIVEVNGVRLRPAESVLYTSDGSSAGPYYLPDTGGTIQADVAENEVEVYLNNVKQRLNVDFIVSESDGSSDRYVEFLTAPDANDVIIVAVTHSADYELSDNTLSLRVSPATDSVVTVTTFNDTSEQQILTSVFQGPTETGATTGESFDSVNFDSATLNETPGSFDYTVGIILQTNEFDLGVTISDVTRLLVTLNGQHLVPDADYSINGQTLTVDGNIIGEADVLAVTSISNSVVPEATSFRIFQDMLGNQKISRIIPSKTTALAQALSETDDVIYVDDASTLGQPDIAENIYGVLVVDGERITYRTRDLDANTVSGLRRGVAGTAITSHAVDAVVTNISFAQQLPARYQNTVYKNTFTGDGVTTGFTADNVVIPDSMDSTELQSAVRVIVGGTELAVSEYTVDGVSPASVTLVDAPASNVEVIVYAVQGKVFYAQGASTASDGVALQEQETIAARFIRGDI